MPSKEKSRRRFQLAVCLCPIPARHIAENFVALATSQRVHPLSFQTRENGLQNAPRDLDAQVDPQAENALVEALEAVFEKTLAEAAAGAVAGAGAGEGSQKSQPSRVANSATLAAASEQPRGKTTPESTPGSFAPADKATNYTPEHQAKMGQSGSWESLGLPSLRGITPDEPRGEGKTKLADARKRIAKGETIKDPLGGSHEINAKTTSHWTKKGKNIDDINERLALLDEAEDTISKPHEIWKGVKRKGTAFIRMVKTPDGKSVINVAEMKDGTISWHGNEVSFDYWREGKLLYVR